MNIKFSRCSIILVVSCGRLLTTSPQMLMWILVRCRIIGDIMLVYSLCDECLSFCHKLRPPWIPNLSRSIPLIVAILEFAYTVKWASLWKYIKKQYNSHQERWERVFSFRDLPRGSHEGKKERSTMRKQTQRPIFGGIKSNRIRDMNVWVLISKYRFTFISSRVVWKRSRKGGGGGEYST